MTGIQIETKLRPCYILNNNEKKKALFHCWAFNSDIIGGHPGGTVAYTTGIVEFEDGCITEVNPMSLIWCRKWIEPIKNVLRRL